MIVLNESNESTIIIDILLSTLIQIESKVFYFKIQSHHRGS